MQESLKPAAQIEQDLEKEAGMPGIAAHVEGKDHEKSEQEV